MSDPIHPVMTEQAPHDHNGGARLVAMANDIGNYFRPQGREEAIAGIASHIERFWTPRMRTKLNVFLAQGGGGAEHLDELPRAALERVNEREAAKRRTGVSG
jgi:formate dehydrogenase subunit delta